MKLRLYQSSDLRDLAELFYQTVHSVNAKDYTKEQLDVWATGIVDFEQWDNTLSEHISLIAEEDNKIVGFGDIDKTGYLDRLYVHKDYQRRGIASVICKELERAVLADKITVHASITAKPFFLARGYGMIREQQVIRQGIFLINYLMEKKIFYTK